MSEQARPEPPKHDAQSRLAEIIDLVHKHHVVEQVLDRSQTPHRELAELVLQRQQIGELKRKLKRLHPADIAHLLETLPIVDRTHIWQLVRGESEGEILLELSDAVRESLIAQMTPTDLQQAAAQLDSDELADLADNLPSHVLHRVMDAMDAENRARFQASRAYPEDTVGALMDYEMVSLREEISLDVCLRYLRRRRELPAQTDKLFITDRGGMLKGVLPLAWLIQHKPEQCVAEVMARDVVTFHPEDSAQAAALAFERYDLLSAPVVDEAGRVIGRIAIDQVMDFLREDRDTERLNLAGLRQEEDWSAGIWSSARNRWPWLAVNLLTALVASRVIGLFETTIEQVVALATLLPIIAGICGNTGNQTAALIIRALALNHINENNQQHVFAKELGVAVLNGLVWGAIVGTVAYALYGQFLLGFVMTVAMIVTLGLAALCGVLIPIGMHRLGRDPVMGTSILLTATIDSGGFFIFLGLASLLLI